jgi:hypothetical protein
MSSNRLLKPNEIAQALLDGVADLSEEQKRAYFYDLGCKLGSFPVDEADRNEYIHSGGPK